MGGAGWLHPLPSDGAAAPSSSSSPGREAATSSSPPAASPLMRNDAVNRTKTVNHQHKTCDIPTAVHLLRLHDDDDDDGQPKSVDSDVLLLPVAQEPLSSLVESFNQPGIAASAAAPVAAAATSTYQLPAAGNVVADHAVAARITGTPSSPGGSDRAAIAKTASLSKAGVFILA